MGNVSPILDLAMKTCAIIPCFNTAASVGEIVRKIRSQAIDVLVIDDGSTDSTSKEASINGATVLKNQINSGKGASLRKGFDYGLDKDYEAILTLDGDGQHLPEDIPVFIKASLDNPHAQMIIGNRMHRPREMPRIRQLTNKFMSCLLSLIAHQNIPDSQNGFRLIKRSILQQMELNSDRFEIESELIIQAAKKDARIISVHISSVYRGGPSQINPFRDTLRFIKFLLPYLLGSEN